MQKILLTVNEDRSITRTDNLDGSVLSETLNDLFIEFTLPSFITDNMTKTAIIGEGVKPPFTIILDETNIVPVPEEVLKYTSFYVSIYGYDIDNKVRVTCKSIEINIGTSGYSDGDTPPDPTPTIYEQLLASLEKHPTVDEVNVLISNYMDDKFDLSDKEEQMLETMWREGRPLTRSEIINLTENRRWNERDRKSVV